MGFQTLFQLRLDDFMNYQLNYWKLAFIEKKMKGLIILRGLTLRVGILYLNVKLKWIHFYKSCRFSVI